MGFVLGKYILMPKGNLEKEEGEETCPGNNYIHRTNTMSPL
jgi:hypothetical protein